VTEVDLLDQFVPFPGKTVEYVNTCVFASPVHCAEERDSSSRIAEPLAQKAFTVWPATRAHNTDKMARLERTAIRILVFYPFTTRVKMKLASIVFGR
jgi:hypothetical protein